MTDESNTAEACPLSKENEEWDHAVPYEKSKDDRKKGQKNRKGTSKIRLA